MLREGSQGSFGNPGRLARKKYPAKGHGADRPRETTVRIWRKYLFRGDAVRGDGGGQVVCAEGDSRGREGCPARVAPRQRPGAAASSIPPTGETPPHRRPRPILF